MNCKNVKEVNDNEKEVNVVTTDLDDDANLMNNIHVDFGDDSNNSIMNTKQNRYPPKRFEVKW